MPDDTELQKLRLDYPDFFQKISPELIDFIFSEETSSKITNIYTANNITSEEKISEVSYRIALVLLGRLPKESLIMALEGGVGLPAETAQKISLEANRLIFSVAPKPQSESVEEKPAQMTEEIPPAQKPASKDVYREPVL